MAPASTVPGNRPYLHIFFISTALGKFCVFGDHPYSFRSARELRAEFYITIIGTALENYFSTLWTLFNFLTPGLLGSLKKFNEKFAIPIERNQDKDARIRLRKLIRPFILRRLKSDVLQELPAKTEITLEVEMSPEEQGLYEAQRQRALDNIEAHREEEPGRQNLRILGRS